MNVDIVILALMPHKMHHKHAHFVQKASMASKKEELMKIWLVETAQWVVLVKRRGHKSVFRARKGSSAPTRPWSSRFLALPESTHGTMAACYVFSAQKVSTRVRI